MAVHVGQAKVTAIVTVGEFLVVQSQLMEDGGVQIVHVHLAFHGMVAVLVGVAMGEAGLKAAAGKPGREAIRVVVAASALVLRVGRSTKFAAPPHDGVIQQATLLEVLQERGHRLVTRLGMLHMFGQVRMLIPRGIISIVRVVDLNVAHTGFAQAPGHQAVTAIIIRFLLVNAVHLPRLCAFLR